MNCDWDKLDQVAQRLENEPLAAATVLVPYFPGQSWFARLRALAEEVLVFPWNQEWVCRPQQQVCDPVGPEKWSACAMVIPARRPGPTWAISRRPPLSLGSVDRLLLESSSIELPAHIDAALTLTP